MVKNVFDLLLFTFNCCTKFTGEVTYSNPPTVDQQETGTSQISLHPAPAAPLLESTLSLLKSKL